MAKPRVGAQLIVFGERAGKDLTGCVKACAAAGYDGFEMGTMENDAQFQRTKAACEAGGIAVAGCHTGIDQLADLEKVKTFVKYAKAVGSDYLMSSGNGGWKTMEEYLAGAKVLNAAGKVCQEAGVALCYHNHHWEFKQIEGQTPMHVMIAATDPKLVKLCPDVYWVHVGGEQPAEFTACYRDRVPYFHFKDGLGGDQFREFRELGQGNVDLPAALKAALATNPAWITIEQDSSKLDPAESVKVSREYLKSLGL